MKDERATALRAEALWVHAGFLEGDWEALPEGPAGPLDARPALSVPGERLPRADRVTQLVAATALRALEGLEGSVPEEQVGVLTASVLGTAQTNERYELRRQETGAAEPRAFAYTAPNAAGGELSVYLRARGPVLSLVGDAEVGLAAVELALRWLRRGRCARVVLVAVECPQERSVLTRGGARPVECCAAWVLDAGEGDPVRAGWVGSEAQGALEAHAPWLSVGPLAELARARRRGERARVEARAPAGGLLWVERGTALREELTP